MTAECPTDFFIFPFDSHTCKFIFIIWGAVDTRITFVRASPHGTMDYYMNNSNWLITQTKQYCRTTGAVNEFIFELTLKREPWYNIGVIILPTLLFCLMNPIVFFLPVESGERVSTILLSYAIFLTLVLSLILASSKPVCLMMFVMILIMVISGLIVVSAIFSIHVYYKDTVRPFVCMNKSTGHQIKLSKCL